MGISVSSTRTNDRLIQQRQLRRLKKYSQNQAIQLQPSPKFSNPLPKQSPIKDPTINTKSQSQDLIKNSQNFQINLKTTGNRSIQDNKLSTSRNQSRQLIIKRDNIKQSSPSHFNQPLTITHNKVVEGSVQGQSSMQEINFAETKDPFQHIKISPLKKLDQNNNKNVTSTSQRNIILTNEEVPPKDQQNEETQQEKVKRKIEQAKKYIEQAAYPSKNNLNTISTYQQKSSKRIEAVNSNKNFSVDLSVKIAQNSQVPQFGNIKLKTEEDRLDEVKRTDRLINQKPVGSSRKNTKNSSFSLNMLNKKL